MYVTSMPVILGGVSNMIFTKTPLYQNHRTPIDGGYVYMLPAKDGKAVDEIRKVLGGMETLHEKRGKPLTYDLISLFELRTDDPAAVKRTISEFMGEGFPVRIRAVTANGLTVATLNPRGLKGKLSHLYSISEKNGDVPVLTLRMKETK